MEVFVDDYIAKLVFLEKAVGHKAHYRIMEPFSPALGIGSDRYVEIQVAAKRIASFIGLTGLTFLIEPKKPGVNTCGSIELRADSSEVFVQLSPDLFGFPAAVLTTLAHEISHKFLHLNKLSWGAGKNDQYHNEVLTDITAVFLGLGKLMLNGRYSESVDTTALSTTTHTREIGYLNGDQLAFVYLLVCQMRGIERSEFMSGLNSFCVYRVADISSRFRRYLRPELHDRAVADTIRARSSLCLAKARRESEHLLREMRTLSQLLSLAETIANERSQTQTSAIASALEDLNSSADPCLTYIAALRLSELSKAPASESQGVLHDVKAATDHIDSAKQRLAARSKRSNSLLHRLVRGLKRR